MAEHFELIDFGLLVAVAGLVVPEVKLAPELVLLRGLPAGRGIEHFGYTRVGDPSSGDSG